jgi:hypothetical protein
LHFEGLQWRFSQISIQTWKYYFSKKNRKISKKNELRFFRKLAQKKVSGTLNIKLANVKRIFWSFSGQILTKNIFWLNSETNTLKQNKKNAKNAKISRFFSMDLIRNTFCRNPEAIWCTLIPSKSHKNQTGSHARTH